MNYGTSKSRWIVGIAIVVFVLAVWPAFAQEVILPRAKSVQTLFSFESPDAASGWRGLKCELTNKNFSDGKQALEFTMPKYEPGADKWPLVSINWDNGKGYATKDWSHYGRIAFDAWTDTGDICDIALELSTLGTSKKDNWAHHFNLWPGKKNTIVVDLVDIKGSIDLVNIQRVIFFSTMPPHAYTVTIDNFRLLPGDKPALAEFDLAYPNYRDMIFPDGKNLKVSVNIQPEEYNSKASDYILKLSVSSRKSEMSRKTAFHENTILLSMPTSKIPAGLVKLKAYVIKKRTGKIVSRRNWVLHKVTSTQVASMNVYIDSSNNAIVDGKPFFPLGVYGTFDPRYRSETDIDELTDSPFNCILNYGMNNKPKTWMLNYLDRLHSKGLKSIYCLNDTYPTATNFNDSSWEGIKGNEKITSAVVDAYRKHPAVLAWYINDEIPKSLVPQMTEYYKRIRNADSNHPCYIVLCTMPEVKYFADTTDIMGVDPYPIPTSPITTVNKWTDTAQEAVQGHKPVWMVLQAFAWYQHHSDNPDRSHIPTDEELKTGRAPNYEESRCMTYLALTHGAKGIIYWCLYNMKVLPQYKEMWSGMKKIGSEVKALSPMLLSPEDLGMVKCNQPNTNIHTKLKRYNGEFYLMAVNSANDPCTVTLNVGKKLDGDAEVMFEDRIVKLSGSQLTDNFKPLEVHVYNLGK